MATKTISITEEAYNRLLSKKSENESFSEVINKITNKINILDFAGLLTNKETASLTEKIKESRNLSRKRALKVLRL